MVSLRQKVFKFLENNPNVDNDTLKEKFKGESWNSLRTYRNQYYNTKRSSDISEMPGISRHTTKGKEKDLKPLIPPQTANPPSQPNHLSKEEIMKIVSNPVEFVQFLIVEELWKTRDVRWANLFTNILDKTKKLDYETIQEQEWLNQAKDMSLDELVDSVAIKGSISRSTSRRLDELDDTSPSDSFFDV